MAFETLPQSGARLQEAGGASGVPAHPGIQSVFESHGPAAEQIASLAWVLFVGGGIVFVIVLILAGSALLAPPPWRNQIGRPRFVFAAGVVFPAVVLCALLAYNLVATARLLSQPQSQPLRLEIIGEQWWWRVHYLDAEGRVEFATANEVRIPVGRPVELALSSADVIHSFWVPNLAGKLDLVPGRVNRMGLRADRGGVFRGQCAEYCGLAHARMALYVVASDPAGFEAWKTLQRQSAVDDPALRSGRRLFEQRGCGACHAVRGTAATGVLGPDLTHVGGRLSLGAGLLPVNAGTLAGWTASSPHLKPGSRMPAFRDFTGTEQRALAAWLASLQ